MGTGRIEAFSDGVIAVIITIMVLDLQVPHAATWAALAVAGPGIAIYALSFVTIGIFWVNHHHTLHAAIVADARLLWSNLVLLFTLSLVPFVTAYLASARGAALPVACYAIVLALTSAAFASLGAVIALQQPNRGAGFAKFGPFMVKGIAVTVLYVLAVPLAFISVPVSYAIFIAIPAMYALPDRRLAR